MSEKVNWKSMVIVASIGMVVIISLSYLASFLVTGGLELPENMPPEEKRELEREMKSKVVDMVWVTVLVVASVVFIPLGYRHWRKNDD